MCTEEFEKVINDKLDAILANSSLKASMSLHLDAYLQFIEISGSKNDILRAKIERMLSESCQNNS